MPEMCAICGEPADMSRTSTGEFRRLWYCRGCWGDWNSQDDGNANVNTMDEQLISVQGNGRQLVHCWSLPDGTEYVIVETSLESAQQRFIVVVACTLVQRRKAAIQEG